MEEKKYKLDDSLQTIINWESIMKMPRHAGGHDEQMRGLIAGAIVVGHWNEGDFQGMVATCIKLPDGRFAIYNDYYGSCSGCDSWEDASDSDVKSMCISLANSALVFESIEDIKDFLSGDFHDGSMYSWGVAKTGLLDAINKNSVT